MVRPVVRAARRLIDRRGRSLGPVLVVGAVALVLWIVAEPVRVVSESMEPTLHDGDLVVVDKLTPKFTDPDRGAVVVLVEPSGERVVKRVVAVAGDEFEIRDGVISIDGSVLRERYSDPAGLDTVYFGPIVVPAGHVFVLGDNRARSIDSLDYGPIPTADVIGVVRRPW